MFFRRRRTQPLYVHIQRAPGLPVGTGGYAYTSAYTTIMPFLGTGVPAGQWAMTGAPPLIVQQAGQVQGLGGLMAGTFAQQPLMTGDYVLTGAGG